MFLIKPPFFRRPRKRRLSRYGQTKEKEEFCEEEVRRAQNATGAQGIEAGTQSFRQAVDVEKGRTGLDEGRQTFAEGFEVQKGNHWLAGRPIWPEPSREEARPVHPQAEGEVASTPRRHGRFHGRCCPGHSSLPR
jgi:hypothetical protein